MYKQTFSAISENWNTFPILFSSSFFLIFSLQIYLSSPRVLSAAKGRRRRKFSGSDESRELNTQQNRFCRKVSFIAPQWNDGWSVCGEWEKIRSKFRIKTSLKFLHRFSVESCKNLSNQIWDWQTEAFDETGKFFGLTCEGEIMETTNLDFHGAGNETDFGRPMFTINSSKMTSWWVNLGRNFRTKLFGEPLSKTYVSTQ